MVGKPDALSTWDGLLDLNEQETIRDDCRKQASEYSSPYNHNLHSYFSLLC